MQQFRRRSRKGRRISSLIRQTVDKARESARSEYMTARREETNLKELLESQKSEARPSAATPSNTTISGSRCRRSGPCSIRCCAASGNRSDLAPPRRARVQRPDRRPGAGSVVSLRALSGEGRLLRYRSRRVRRRWTHLPALSSRPQPVFAGAGPTGPPATNSRRHSRSFGEKPLRCGPREPGVIHNAAKRMAEAYHALRTSLLFRAA